VESNSQHATQFTLFETYTGISLTFFDPSLIAHLLGCPALMLDTRLQDGKRLPKWAPKSYRTQFLGFRSSHSTPFVRILNSFTGWVI